MAQICLDYLLGLLNVNWVFGMWEWHLDPNIEFYLFVQTHNLPPQDLPKYLLQLQQKACLKTRITTKLRTSNSIKAYTTITSKADMNAEAKITSPDKFVLFYLAKWSLCMMYTGALNFLHFRQCQEICKMLICLKMTRFDSSMQAWFQFWEVWRKLGLMQTSIPKACLQGLHCPWR